MASIASTSPSLWSTFSGKAELLGAAVTRTGPGEHAAHLLAEAAKGYVTTASVREHFPGIGTHASAATRGPATEVVARGVFAVAETGSVALNEPAADRAACFLAERLWLLVSEDAITATLDDGMSRMAELVRGGAHHPLLMSGPSRTADIERILTVGVHGPRALVVVVVGAA